MLEPDARKRARPVLRGPERRKVVGLPGERLLRTPVVGRKNYYGSGAEWSGHLAAMVWTLCTTAQQNGHDPATYLTNYLTAYAANGHQPLSEADLAAFLPPAHSADPAVVNAASAAQ